MSFRRTGLTAVHRDVAGGILLALDAGRCGEAYVLGGGLEDGVRDTLAAEGLLPR